MPDYGKYYCYYGWAQKCRMEDKVEFRNWNRDKISLVHILIVTT